MSCCGCGGFCCCQCNIADTLDISFVLNSGSCSCLAGKTFTLTKTAGSHAGSCVWEYNTDPGCGTGAAPFISLTIVDSVGDGSGTCVIGTAVNGSLLVVCASTLRSSFTCSPFQLTYTIFGVGSGGCTSCGTSNLTATITNHTSAPTGCP